MIKKNMVPAFLAGCSLLVIGLGSVRNACASSHQDAPMIVLDPAANTTDVYAFLSDRADGQKYLTVSLAVYPFEEPGVGPNKWNFDPNVRYQISVATGDDVAAGRPTYTYTFKFTTDYKNRDTILQSYLGVVQHIGDANQNLTQRYSVTKSGAGGPEDLFTDVVVPPNNQGLVTPYYNQDNNGNKPAKEGVAFPGGLDRYTREGIATNEKGYQVFAGQRDDGFYADIQSIFDLDFSFSGPDKPFDSQGGFNVHTIVLNIPVSEVGGAKQGVGVYATTSRRQVRVLRDSTDNTGGTQSGKFVQVGRQGNPLFCEAFIAIRDKDLYNRTAPSQDAMLFEKYALRPELAAILGLPENLRKNRTDLAGIFIPDLIKVDLSTKPARLAGGINPGAVRDDPGFNRLGIFGGGPNHAGGSGPDVLHSTIQNGFLNNGTLPGGWPNGRRFGDDVLDIAVLALLSDLRNPAAPTLATAPADPGIDKVDHNDIGYNKTFPYAATAQNGRSHEHHDHE